MRNLWLAPIALSAALVGCGESVPESKINVEPTVGSNSDKGDKSVAKPGAKGNMNTDPNYPKGDPQPGGAKDEMVKPVPPEIPVLAKPEPEAPGLEKAKDAEPKADAPKADAPKSAALSAEETSEIAKLAAPADQKLANAQMMCPVSAEHLGSMGAPIKKVVDGKTAFLCCKGCEKDFDKDPKPFLAKLAAAKP